MEAYQIGEVVGRGQSSTVYSATHKPSKKPVALKVIHKQTSAITLDSLRKEVTIHKQLRHENVIRLLACFETEEEVVFVSELAGQQGDLLSVIRSRSSGSGGGGVGPFTTTITTAAIAHGLVEGLSYLHCVKRIIHRDLKPQNILLGLDGNVKICDFGFAIQLPEKLFEGDDDDNDDYEPSSSVRQRKNKPHSATTPAASTTTNTTYTAPTLPPHPATKDITSLSIKGTPIYMAPELVQERGDYNHLVDLWALGIILFELETGLPPFYTTNIFTLVNLILNAELEWPLNETSSTTTSYKTDPLLKDCVGRLLEKDPKLRIDWPDLAFHPYIDRDGDHDDHDKESKEEETKEKEDAVKDKLQQKSRDSSETERLALLEGIRREFQLDEDEEEDQEEKQKHHHHQQQQQHHPLSDKEEEEEVDVEKNELFVVKESRLKSLSLLKTHESVLDVSSFVTATTTTTTTTSAADEDGGIPLSSSTSKPRICTGNTVDSAVHLLDKDLEIEEDEEEKEEEMHVGRLNGKPVSQPDPTTNNNTSTSDAISVIYLDRKQILVAHTTPDIYKSSDSIPDLQQIDWSALKSHLDTAANAVTSNRNNNTTTTAISLEKDPEMLSLIANQLVSNFHAYKYKDPGDQSVLCSILSVVAGVLNGIPEYHNSTSGNTSTTSFVRRIAIWLASLLTGFLDMATSSSSVLMTPSNFPYRSVMVSVLQTLNVLVSVMPDLFSSHDGTSSSAATPSTPSLWSVVGVIVQQFLPLLPRLISSNNNGSISSLLSSQTFIHQLALSITLKTCRLVNSSFSSPQLLAESSCMEFYKDMLDLGVMTTAARCALGLAVKGAAHASTTSSNDIDCGVNLTLALEIARVLVQRPATNQHHHLYHHNQQQQLRHQCVLNETVDALMDQLVAEFSVLVVGDSTKAGSSTYSLYYLAKLITLDVASPPLPPSSESPFLSCPLLALGLLHQILAWDTSRVLLKWIVMQKWIIKALVSSTITTTTTGVGREVPSVAGICSLIANFIVADMADRGDGGEYQNETRVYYSWVLDRIKSLATVLWSPSVDIFGGEGGDDDVNLIVAPDDSVFELVANIARRPQDVIDVLGGAGGGGKSVVATGSPSSNIARFNVALDRCISNHLLRYTISSDDDEEGFVFGGSGAAGPLDAILVIVGKLLDHEEGEEKKDQEVEDLVRLVTDWCLQLVCLLAPDDASGEKEGEKKKNRISLLEIGFGTAVHVLEFLNRLQQRRPAVYVSGRWIITIGHYLYRINLYEHHPGKLEAKYGKQYSRYLMRRSGGCGGATGGGATGGNVAQLVDRFILAVCASYYYNNLMASATSTTTTGDDGSVEAALVSLLVSASPCLSYTTRCAGVGLVARIVLSSSLSGHGNVVGSDRRILSAFYHCKNNKNNILSRVGGSGNNKINYDWDAANIAFWKSVVGSALDPDQADKQHDVRQHMRFYCLLDVLDIWHAIVKDIGCGGEVGGEKYVETVLRPVLQNGVAGQLVKIVGCQSVLSSARSLIMAVGRD